MAKKNSDNEKSTSGGIKKFLVIVLALLVLGAGGFGGVYFYMQSTSDVEKPIVEEKVPVAEDIMVRLADESGKSYLKATINISYDKRNKKVGKELNSKLTEVKDATLFYLMSKKIRLFILVIVMLIFKQQKILKLNQLGLRGDLEEPRN